MPATNLRLSKIIVYPVKSCAPCQNVTEWPLCETGLKYDRCWMIVDGAGVYLTQRRHPHLCFINTQLNFEDRTLRLNYADLKSSEISVPLDIDTSSPRTIRTCENQVLKDKVEAVDCGDEIADWLSDYVDIPGLRLVREFNSQRKATMGDGFVSFPDEDQVLLATEASISWLSEKLQDYTYIDLSDLGLMLRFRPNFLIAGDIEPFSEHNWQSVTIGSTVFKVVGTCARCHMINVDQFTSEKCKEVFMSLPKDPSNGKPLFGMYLSMHPDAPNKLMKINEHVTITLKDDS